MKTFKINLKKLSSTALLAVLIGATVYSCKCDKKVDRSAADAATAAGAGAAATTDSTATAPKGQVDADGNFVADVGEDTTLKLADGTTLTVGSNSTEANLYNKITGNYAIPADPGAGDWVRLDRVFFASGGDQLTEQSQAQVDNIAKILKAYPNAKLKLGGYTDNTGGAEINKKVSTERAEKVKSQLESLGVAGDRLEAEGFGPEFPVCAANDTDECKAQNRRVDLRLTAK